ncbi:short-chain type dehydrogenase, putative [Talaromyces stipitatus ATCC 10500]|uniref:Short-chain type dehydrogenase, putative n=1 Tax=Talaromyces stipitatus (strain ATCC 10500 / CBS 375.48 / QM 6759 / NRRL 1006) TaxID=441959 RepID=B8LV29_TALSN|nr:short-chain type dehydrogenase, putative [Talaromyces stipitatus ATCC 10500]EED22650.1 short-chain type dehydrogenase, putative [Talaromyces stipitatus ATCC 10500]
MPPPRGTPNILEGPGDYDVTSIIHSESYPAIDSRQFDFSGKAIFVTGASRGLGCAMVLSFVRAGASFIAAGARSDMSHLAKDVATTAESTNREAPKFLAVNLNVADPKSVEDAAALVEREFGRIDIVINNAGLLGSHGGITDTDPEEWWNIMSVNLRGPYLVARSFLPMLVKSPNPYIIQVTSVAAHLLNPTLTAYQTSKASLLRFTQLIDAEYGKQGVTAFAIHPGNCPTDMMGGPGGLHDFEKHIFVDSSDLSADTIAFLTAEKRQWLGGRYINVTWDMPELVAKKDDIVQGDKLKNRFVF